MVVLTLASADKMTRGERAGATLGQTLNSKNVRESIPERQNSRSALLRHIRSLSNTFEIWRELLFGILDALNQEELIFFAEDRRVTFRSHALTLSEVE